MAILNLVDKKETYERPEVIATFLKDQGIVYQQWKTQAPLDDSSSDEDVLKAYESQVKTFMEETGYQTTDVINVHPETPNIEALREKFLKEHTHSEDEVRFFVEGEGLFWFNVNGQIFSVLCEKGDFISVPSGYKHWFDLAPKYRVKAIRIFKSKEGWVANYTNSGVDERYNP